MSQFRVEKRRAEADVTLATGAVVRGAFFLAGSAPRRDGPERVADLLNAEPGFFPFETASPDRATLLINRAHVVCVRLLERADEAQLDPGYAIATVRRVQMVLTTGATLTGVVRVYWPQGRDRLSDYARSADAFRYLESPEGTFVVNTAHVVNLSEIQAAP